MGIGTQVRVRLLNGSDASYLPPGVTADDVERVLTIVPPDDGGLYRLSPRTPLGAALMGHRPGDVVVVISRARSIEYEIVSVEPDSPVAGVAELEDAAVLDTAPSGGPGSTPGTCPVAVRRAGPGR